MSGNAKGIAPLVLKDVIYNSFVTDDRTSERVGVSVVLVGAIST